jgi:hypothetical protein
MLNLENPFFNTIVAYTVLLFCVYLTRPNMFIDENIKIIHNDITLYIIGVPILLYFIFTYLKYNQ